MIIFLIKLIAAPLLLALATLAARRWGTVLGGILIGLPLISGPISVFLAIENGAGFAVETARGALAGTVALAVFTCVYAAVCPKGWLKASFLSVALYVLASWIAAELPISARDAGSLRCGRHRPFALDHARSSQCSRETPSAET